MYILVYSTYLQVELDQGACFKCCLACRFLLLLLFTSQAVPLISEDYWLGDATKESKEQFSLLMEGDYHTVLLFLEKRRDAQKA